MYFICYILLKSIHILSTIYIIEISLFTLQRSFILLNCKHLKDHRAVISAVLPLIINKDVQLQFSGCGRETRGQKKENFSKTLTNQILKGSRYYMDTISKFSILIYLLYITNFLFFCYRHCTRKIFQYIRKRL